MFKPNYDSYYKKYANQSLDWLEMDVKNLYEKNIKENYQLLKLNNWIDKSFTYKFNSHGFRCNEFSDDPTIMFLGASSTVGVGLPIDYIWPEVISKNLNMRCANLAIGGSSCDTAFRLCHGWIDIIKPHLVIFFGPPSGRLELVNADTITNLNLAWPDTNKDFLKKWGIDDNNIYFNEIKNRLAIENLCLSRNIKFHFVNFGIDKIDLARDLMHSGINSNQKFAEKILARI